MHQLENDADPAGWSGHVVVCGLHDEGIRVVEQLHAAGVRAVMVDEQPDPRLVPALPAPLAPNLRAAGFANAAALICVESDDVQALAIVLNARELRPSARIVVQLRNAAVGRALADVGIVVLDVAAIAAPSMVEAALRTGRTALHLGEVELAVVEAVSRQAGTLRELYGDLVPLGVVQAGGTRVDVAPGRDHFVEPGDVVVLAGTGAEVSRAELIDRRSPRAERVFVSSRAPRPNRVRRGLPGWHLLAGVERRIKIAIGALLGLATLSVVMLLIGYHEPNGRRMSPLDALYFTVETIGTVGYGDFYFRDQNGWLRLWAICLMVVGATLATVFFALVTNALVSRRLEETLGSRLRPDLDGHVIVVGAGSVGIEVVRQLRARGVDSVVLEEDPGNRFRAVLRSWRVPVVIADATVPETWTRLHLARARAVVVVTSDDLVNIETGLAVRDLLGERWSRVPVVLRIFDTRLAGTVESTFGFGFVRSPATLAAPWFVGAALGLEVIDTFYLGDEPLLVARLAVRAGGGLDGTAMRQLSARIRVLSLVRADGSVEARPRRDTRFVSGDAAYLVGPYGELLGLLRADLAVV